jgi:hypothetical protein
MSIKTIQDYANMKGTSPQNVINKKSLPLVKCGIYALYKGEYIHLKDQTFVEVENNEPENQQLTK